jgi:hypothetical protein
MSGGAVEHVVPTRGVPLGQHHGAVDESGRDLDPPALGCRSRERAASVAWSPATDMVAILARRTAPPISSCTVKRLVGTLTCSPPSRCRSHRGASSTGPTMRGPVLRGFRRRGVLSDDRDGVHHPRGAEGSGLRSMAGPSPASRRNFRPQSTWYRPPSSHQRATELSPLGDTHGSGSVMVGPPGVITVRVPSVLHGTSGAGLHARETGMTSRR